MGKDILSMYGPERTIRSSGSNQGRNQRDVMNYAPPTRVKTPYDPKGPGLHGDYDNDADGAQGGDYGGCQSSGSVGIGGDSIRSAGSQGRR